MTASTAPIGITVGTGVLRKALPWALLVAGVVVFQVLAAGETFPAVLDDTFSDRIDQLQSWMRSNRRTHPLFTGFFTPLSNAIEWGLTAVSHFLLWLPWYVIPLTVFGVIARTRRYGKAAVAFLASLYPGLVGLWVATMDTLALMAIAVLICLIVGIPLGVVAAFRPGLERAMRPVLDAMQTIPAPIYFIPMVLLLGIGRVPATVATVIYALPPLIRLTTLGVRRADPQAVEASRVFGSTPRQTLFKVQLPLAMPTVMTGVNQTIMMALGIVVLATLLGAGGLGQEVIEALQQRSPGRGLGAGLAIVAVAVILDRIGQSLADTDRTHHIGWRPVFAGVGVLAGIAVLGRIMGWVQFPGAAGVSVLDPIDTGVIWIRDNLSFVTRPFSDFMVADILIPARDFLVGTVAWPVLVFFTGWLCWVVKGWRLAVAAMLMVTFVGLIGMWALTIETLTHVVTAVILSVLIAVPVGVWAGRNRRTEATLAPFLDALQTIPSFVYIIPVVMFFTISAVPGIVASVAYAISPGIRITALGVRQVPGETVEASRAYGATPSQSLYGVRIPLAAPTILAGVNQVIMMVLAMLIIAGMVGGGALGFEMVRAVTASESGLGFEVAVAVVTMAIVLDRLTQAWGDRLRPPG